MLIWVGVGAAERAESAVLCGRPFVLFEFFKTKKNLIKRGAQTDRVLDVTV